MKREHSHNSRINSRINVSFGHNYQNDAVILRLYDDNDDPDDHDKEKIKWERAEGSGCLWMTRTLI